MRYLYFYIRYNQWFKNHNGIKAFANQAIHWLLESTLSLSSRLKKENKKLSENIKSLKSDINERIKYPVINADEYPSLRGKIIIYTIIIYICVIGETFFNYFASRAIFTFQGWAAIIASLFFALLITWGSISLFENLIEQILLEPHYKSERKSERNIKKIILLLVFAISYEALIYYICRVRGIQIEGGNGDGIIGTAMMIAGMLMPVVAGYYSYEKGKYISAYKNTKKISTLVNRVALSERKIQTNREKMENHFKKNLQNRWAVIQEFKTYKENYNFKHSVPEENLIGHFCETQEDFRQEAIERYKKQNIYNDSIQNLALYNRNKNLGDQSVGYSVN
ncbi:MAG: hypothetical protein COW71_13375 [Ignavibacteriales bacterium CG18_big_fil_WC_8_21_14_2_50_31_20]|nr:MAG: hypothetical protein COW71_13375 [Ignavibacteriales bacterium CG18_big_fil_WC_8_21_14_2_50_31_20]